MFQMAHSEYKVVHNRKGTETPDEFTHPDYDFLVSHPDRLCRESGGEQKIAAGLEIKTTNWMNFRQYGEEGTDKIPDYYLTQVIFYLGMTGLPIWHVAVAFLNEGGGLRQYKEFLVHNDDFTTFSSSVALIFIKPRPCQQHPKRKLTNNPQLAHCRLPETADPIAAAAK